MAVEVYGAVFGQACQRAIARQRSGGAFFDGDDGVRHKFEKRKAPGRTPDAGKTEAQQATSPKKGFTVLSGTPLRCAFSCS